MSNFFAIVDKDSPAFAVIKKNINKIKPGAVIAVTAEELDAWRTDVEIVELSHDPRIDVMWQFLGLDPDYEVEVTPVDDKAASG